MLSVHEIEAQVLRMGAEDRSRILERLLASFEPDSQVDKAWVSEALRREADVFSGAVQMVSGEQAIARVHARIANL
ncbi:MAG: hypothetical protein CR991_03745 [Proteobacteria bacterium]|nr:MAG: hypothetical protein CR991_03745 [Pseudomonadota bacterium]